VSEFGVHSEVGKLRKVIVHRPGLEMRRLTPANSRELLFEEVPWAKRAREEHDAFVSLMQDDHGVDVMEVNTLLEAVVDDPAGRAYLLDRRLVPDEVGVLPVREMRSWMDELDPVTLVTHLIGGVTVGELPGDFRVWASKAYGENEFVLPPLPNQLFTRDSSCWIYDGVTLNPMYFTARRKETLNMAAIYRFHPSFAGGDFSIWWGDPPDVSRGSAMLEGGDVMPVGDGIVLVGMGERTTYQAVGQLAESLFDHGAATRVIAAKMPRDRASMHLDTVFTFCDRDRVGMLGGSYGGFMATTLAARYGDRFRGICSERSVNNMLTEEWSSDIATFFRSEHGPNPVEDPEEYLRLSPITMAGDIHVPMLIIHSEEDFRCPINQAEELWVTLRLLKRDVTFYRFPGENHELSRGGSPVHRRMRAEIILDWFAEQLSVA